LSSSDDLTDDERSDPVTYGLCFRKSVDCRTVGFGFFHYHRKCHLKLGKGHYSASLFGKEIEVADESEHSV